MTEIAIHTEGLSRRFGAVKAVDGLTLDVPAGSVFGFLGPNGSGKTTTIRLLLGLLQPSAGQARVLGWDTRTQADEIRRRCGALLEHSGLYERMSAEDNLEFYGRIAHLPAAERRARIRELLERAGLWERRREAAGTWSRGMQQKLAVARALLHRPLLLFLGEPTAGLDPLAAAALRDDLAHMAQSEGVTVFLTTHNLAEAERLCARVAVIRRGRLLDVGSPQELRARAGGGAVRVELFGRGLDERVVALLQARPEVAAVRPNNGHVEIELRPGADVAPLVAVVVGAGAQVEELRKGNASLEEAFLELVGDQSGPPVPAAFGGLGRGERCTMTQVRSASLWTDVATVLWKEWREVLSPRRRGAGRSGWLSMAVNVAVFGIFLPLQNGRAWLESPLTLVYWGWMPLFLVSGVVADAFAGERERHTLETLLASQLSDNAILLGKLAAAVSYGCLLTLAGLIVGAVTVSVAHGQGRLLFYPALIAVGGMALCLLGAGLAASAGVLISLRAATVRQAVQTLSIGAMLLIFVPVYGLQALPAGIKVAVAARLATLDARAGLLLVLLLLAALDGALLLASRLRFQRAKLAVES